MVVDQVWQSMEDNCHFGISWGLIIPGWVTRVRLSDVEKLETPMDPWLYH